MIVEKKETFYSCYFESNEQSINAVVKLLKEYNIDYEIVLTELKSLRILIYSKPNCILKPENYMVLNKKTLEVKQYTYDEYNRLYEEI